MLILGLTGGISTGKSTVSSYFQEKYQIPVIDADEIAREVVEPGTPCYNDIIKYFGPRIDGLIKSDPNTGGSTFDRAKLGKYVFTHKEELKVLNSITHPAIRKRILYKLFKLYWEGNEVAILDVPLLFESGMDWLCSRVLTITCDSNKQLERLLSRNKELSEQDAKNRINSQYSMEKKLQLTDYTIYNNLALKDLKLNIDNFVIEKLPGLKFNKKDCGWKWKLNNYWNWLQIIIPPFAVAGVLAAITRKTINKLYNILFVSI